MFARQWPAIVLTLLVSGCLGGCSGNYKFSDDTYRPLGDPHVVNRGK